MGIHYYSVKSEGPFGKLSTIDEFKQIFLNTKQEKMKKEIVGYKLNGLITPEKAAKIFECSDEVYPDGCFVHITHTNSSGTGLLDKIKKLGVLDLWFEPVYKQHTITLTLGSKQIKIKITPNKKIVAEGKNIPIKFLKEIYEDMDDNIFHENTTGWKVEFPQVKIGCSMFEKTEIKQIIDTYNKK